MNFESQWTVANVTSLESLAWPPLEEASGQVYVEGLGRTLSQEKATFRVGRRWRMVKGVGGEAEKMTYYGFYSSGACWILSIFPFFSFFHFPFPFLIRFSRSVMTCASDITGGDSSLLTGHTRTNLAPRGYWRSKVLRIIQQILHWCCLNCEAGSWAINYWVVNYNLAVLLLTAFHCMHITGIISGLKIVSRNHTRLVIKRRSLHLLLNQTGTVTK